MEDRLRLKRLRIGKLWNIAPATTLVFGPQFNVLLGRNGTGKTTLLRLVAMIVKSDFSPLRNEAFEIEYDLGLDGHEVRVKFSNQRRGDPQPSTAAALPANPRGEEQVGPRAPKPGTRFEWALVVRGQTHDGALRYEVEATAAGGELRVMDDPAIRASLVGIDAFDRHLRDVTWAALDALPTEPLVPDMPPDSPMVSTWRHREVARMLFTLQEAISVDGGRYDEALGTLEAMLGRSRDDADNPTAQVQVHGPLRAGFSGVTGRFVPPDVIEAIMEEASKRDDMDPRKLPSQLALGDDRVAWLRETVRLCGFRGAEMRFYLTHRDADEPDGAAMWSYGKIDFLFTLDDDTIIDQDRLSWGQKRLLSFLYHAALSRSVVIADELVNGLHHGWIGACVQAIEERQSLLASQNPLLLDSLWFSSAEEVGSCFLRCSTQVKDGRSSFVWRNLDEEEAERFFRAYRAGLQHVGEILEVEGLW